MIAIDPNLQPNDLAAAIQRLWSLSAEKIHLLESQFDPSGGAPVTTVDGRYTARGWTDWTQGFQFGSAVLQYDATDDREFLDMARRQVRSRMAVHVTHFGVHDHGFNNVSTYGNLLRLMNEGRLEENEYERAFYELALKASGAVQAHRWTRLGQGGYIYSFNGPHSLFIDTLRSLRSLAIAYRLGHSLRDESDAEVNLLHRLVAHARTTARYNVYYGEGRDAWDVRGRVAQESVFNVTDGSYRCPSTQQGYSPFTTWTRGLAWAMLGFAEQLEFISELGEEEFGPAGPKADVVSMMLDAARATCDFYIANTPPDGIPYWDTGAPNLNRIGDYLDRPAQPFNDWEPVDSSAASVAAQGLLRLGDFLSSSGDSASAVKYRQAGLTVTRTLLTEPYLSASPQHQGLILHSLYHRPRGWDRTPPGARQPCGESGMWGDYHARELALCVLRMTQRKPKLRFAR